LVHWFIWPIFVLMLLISRLIQLIIKVMAWYWIVLITLGAVILGGVIAIAWILIQIGGK
jgi:hypothetical protein